MSEEQRRLSNQSVWLEPFSKWQKRILLHGIETIPSACECHRGERDPIIPHLNQLIELSTSRKDCFEFQWDGDKWIAIMPNINQA